MQFVSTVILYFRHSRRELHIPHHVSVLHVEQEVAGDNTLAVESVLECDVVRTELLNEEKRLTAALNMG